MIDSTLPAATAGSTSGGVREIKATAMTDALASGRAQYLSATIRDFVRYKGAWWLLDRDLWFLADDEELIASLDAAAETMRMLDANVKRKAR
ncbi:hypothetical protein ABUW04_32160 [Streptacidiphilus sp. N1-10]|uniref:Uncharacterized protein n=1 Tax=Streptacidiphilus jeojiensis TaxID=3229225 RepID=A0ABV6XXD1_9ACTN